jgi:hypothetical protein
MSLRSQTFEFRLNALQLREQFPVESETVGPVAGYKGPTQCIPRHRLRNLAKYQPVEVCYILLEVGEHAGAVCSRF